MSLAVFFPRLSRRPFNWSCVTPAAAITAFLLVFVSERNRCVWRNTFPDLLLSDGLAAIVCHLLSRLKKKNKSPPHHLLLPRPVTWLGGEMDEGCSQSRHEVRQTDGRSRRKISLTPAADRSSAETVINIPPDRQQSDSPCFYVTDKASVHRQKSVPVEELMLFFYGS